MNEIYVQTPLSSYPIGFYNDFEILPQFVKDAKLEGRNLCIVVDSNVYPLYCEKVSSILKESFKKIVVCMHNAGEKSKNLYTIAEFYKEFLNNKVDRKTVIAGLGGGVTGDMAGFAASTYLRGVPFIQIPTTLLSQVDSSVGGKVGVDFMGSKNLIGSFYQPDFVYINTSTLNTLPKREINSGLAEAIKYGLIVSKEYYNYFLKNRGKIKKADADCIKEIIKNCCMFKADVVSKDEKESGLREILNFGHTIGHSIESAKDFSLLHGECVGVGMMAVMYISYKRGNITLEEFEEFKDLLEFFEIPIKAEGLNAVDVYNGLFNDKKVKNNKIGFVLLNKIGEAYRTDSVSYDEIMSAISYVL